VPDNLLFGDAVRRLFGARTVCNPKPRWQPQA